MHCAARRIQRRTLPYLVFLNSAKSATGSRPKRNLHIQKSAVKEKPRTGSIKKIPRTGW